MVRETLTNIIKADNMARLRQQPKTEVMSSTIFEDQREDQLNSPGQMALRENNQINSAEEAVNETHRRVSALRQVVASGHLAAQLSEQAILANRLIAQSSREWQTNTGPNNGWIDQFITALCNAKYPELAVDLLRQLLERGLSLDEPTEAFLRNIYGTLMNLTDRSDHFREAMASADLVDVLIDYLKAAEVIKGEATNDMRKEDFLRFSLAIIHNLAKNPDIKTTFVEQDAATILDGYLDYSNEYVQCVSLLCIIQVFSDTPEVNSWASKRGVIDTLIEYCRSAMMSNDRRCRGIHAEELAEGLCLLAVNKTFKEKLIQHSKITSVVKSLLESHDTCEQARGVELAWQLSFIAAGKVKIQHDCLQSLRHIANSSVAEAAVKRNAAKTISYIEHWEKLNPHHVVEANDYNNNGSEGTTTEQPHSEEATKTSNCEASTSVPNAPPPATTNNTNANTSQRNRRLPGGGHIFLSYCHRQKDIVQRIYEKLRAKGMNNLWIDVHNMSNDWINDMARAVENASVVLIFYSEAYRRSSNCKAEAEYAFSLQKNIVPIRVQRGYKADGWLGIIVNRILWIEMSSLPINDSSFEKLLREIQSAKNRPLSSNAANNSGHVDISTDQSRQQACCSLM